MTHKPFPRHSDATAEYLGANDKVPARDLLPGDVLIPTRRTVVEPVQRISNTHVAVTLQRPRDPAAVKTSTFNARTRITIHRSAP